MSGAVAVREVVPRGGARRMTPAQLRELRELFMGVRGMEADEVRLWSMFWHRMRLDARGQALESGIGTRQRIALRRDAVEWFRDGEALRFLLWLGTDPERAHRLIDHELRQLGIVNGRAEDQMREGANRGED